MMIMVATTKPYNFSHLFNVETSTIKKTTRSQRLKEWLEKGDALLPNGSQILPNGSCSFGLVKDKGYVDPHKTCGQPANNSKSPKQRLEFLLNLKQILCNQHGAKFISCLFYPDK